MTSRKQLFAGVTLPVCAAILVAGAWFASAGVLTPPAGPVTSTGHTLDEIFNKIPTGGSGDGRIAIAGGTSAVTISQPGSYVLTGDITIANTGTIALAIAANDVTLDLNGWTVRSPIYSGTAIGTNGNRAKITVRNGRTSGFATGVAITGSELLVEDMVVDDARTTGINADASAAGLHGIIRRCIVTNIGVNSLTNESVASIGIKIGDCNGAVEDCMVNFVRSNTLNQTVIGISQTAGTRVTIVNNRVIAAAQGIGTNNISGVVLRNNMILGATLAYSQLHGNVTDGGGNIPPP